MEKNVRFVTNPMMILKYTLFLILLVGIASVKCLVEPKTAVATPESSTLSYAASTDDPLRANMYLYEKFLKNFTNVAVKKALPTMVRMIEKVNMSSSCLSSLLKYVVSLKQIKVWAVRMFDATAKVPSGIFDGTVTEFGAFDQCLNILVKNKKGMEDFRGQYCSVEVVPSLGPRPRNLSLAILPDVKFDDSIIKEMHTTIFAFYQLTLRFGICVPSTCTAEDMRVLGAQVAKPLHYGIRVSKCHVSEELKVEPVHIVVLICLCLLLFMLAGGTTLEWMESKENSETRKTRGKTTLQRIFLCFSLPTNLRRLCASSSRTGEMRALHGIRALSMTWVILGHTYIWINFQALTKSSAASQWFNNLEFEAILNGWLTVSSFIFLSGLLTTHTTLQYLKKTGGKINIFLYIFRRFSRLYPSLLLLLGGMFFLPWIASGPFWPELPGIEVENCKKSWWANLLFINNWRPIREMCMQHSWYISADMQLHIIALLVLIPLHRNAYVGLAVSLFLSVVGCLAVGIITYVYDYDPTILVSTANLPMAYNIVEDIHIKTFTYFGPYCVGAVTGYCLLRKPKVKLGTLSRMLGWCCAIVLALCALYGTHRWNTGRFPAPEVTAVYAAMHRTTFAVALAWVAFDSITFNTGLVSSFLKFRPFVFMSRLTFMAYLAQGPVIWTRYGSLKERIFYSHFNMLYEYLGNLILSLAIAFGGHVLIEAPFANLERLLFTNVRSSAKESTPTTLCQVQTARDTVESTTKDDQDQDKAHVKNVT